MEERKIKERECITKAEKSNRIKLNNLHNLIAKFSENFQKNMQNRQ